MGSGRSNMVKKAVRAAIDSLDFRTVFGAIEG